MKPLENLSYYTGTEAYHKLSPFAKFLCTDGVKYIAETAGAFWLVDAIASYQHKLKNQAFQFWELTLVGIQNKAVLTCTDGNKTTLVTQEIEFTDFPQNIKFYLTDNVLMLVSEY